MNDSRMRTGDVLKLCGKFGGENEGQGDYSY